MIFIILFNACAHLRTKDALNLVKQVSKEMPECYYSHPRLPSALLDASMKCGDTAHAESVFAMSTNKVLSMYGAMMNGKDYWINHNVQSDFASRLCEE